RSAPPSARPRRPNSRRFTPSLAIQSAVDQPLRCGPGQGKGFELGLAVVIRSKSMRSPVPARERELPMTETLRPSLDVTSVRERFSSLRDFAFLDAPGGTQVPDEVGEAITRALREASANLGASYATSRRVGEILEFGADVLLCSPYKFGGPHLGMAFGRAEVIEGWRPYKARPAPTTPLGRRFETGTQPYELLAGFNATIDYLDSIGGFEAIV